VKVVSFCVYIISRIGLVGKLSLTKVLYEKDDEIGLIFSDLFPNSRVI